MTPAQKNGFRLGFLFTLATGLSLGFVTFFVRPSDPFAVVNHPLQPWLRHMHILAGPILIFMVGWLWQDHVLAHIRRRVRTARISGWISALLFPAMAASGYLLQVTMDETWQAIWRWTHISIALIWSLAAATHILRSLLQRRKRRG